MKIELTQVCYIKYHELRYYIDDVCVCGGGDGGGTCMVTLLWWLSDVSFLTTGTFALQPAPCRPADNGCLRFGLILHVVMCCFMHTYDNIIPYFLIYTPRRFFGTPRDRTTFNCGALERSCIHDHAMIMNTGTLKRAAIVLFITYKPYKIYITNLNTKLIHSTSIGRHQKLYFMGTCFRTHFYLMCSHIHT